MIMKKMFAAAAMTLTIAGLTLSFNVGALPAEARMYTYYSDATLTSEVGGGGIGCRGRYSYGVKTAYYTIETFPCF